MNRTLVILLFVVLTLAACSDPFGLVAREKIRADGAIEIAKIEGATERATIAARMGAAVAVTGIVALAAIAVSMVGGATHIVAQRDRLTMEQWRASLPTQPAAPAVTAGRRPGAKPMPLLEFTQRRRAPAPTLALPEHSSTHNVIVIDA